MLVLPLAVFICATLLLRNPRCNEYYYRLQTRDVLLLQQTKSKPAVLGLIWRSRSHAAVADIMRCPRGDVRRNESGEGRRPRCEAVREWEGGEVKVARDEGEEIKGGRPGQGKSRMKRRAPARPKIDESWKEKTSKPRHTATVYVPALPLSGDVLTRC